jgi:PadR family transcriptional regulator, regulatory protein PadR
MLGKFEEITMLAVMQVGANATAANVYKIVKEGRAGSTFGAIFTTLDRLEDKKFLKSDLRLVESAIGRKERKVYELTGLGERTLRDSLRVTNNFVAKIGWAPAGLAVR